MSSTNLDPPFFLVDAFAEKPFKGNPAGVCPLSERSFLPEAWMQSLAMEMNQAETAFLHPLEDGSFHLRWFTPNTEVDLCGHATLASAHILWETGRVGEGETICFETRSGLLTAKKSAGTIWLDFPAEGAAAEEAPPELLAGLGISAVRWAGKNRMDWLVEVESEAELLSLTPEMRAISQLGVRGVIVTARSGQAQVDFVSRFFAPSCDVPEDPVTGSAHCCLAPYWGERLGKTEMTGFQASRRGGFVQVELRGDRVLLGGTAVTILRAQIAF